MSIELTFEINPERRNVILDVIINDIAEHRHKVYDKFIPICQTDAERLFAGFAYGNMINILETTKLDKSEKLRAWDFTKLVEDHIQVRNNLQEAKTLMQEFVDRVEAGEVKSKRTYEKFKTFLAT